MPAHREDRALAEHRRNGANYTEVSQLARLVSRTDEILKQKEAEDYRNAMEWYEENVGKQRFSFSTRLKAGNSV